MQETPLIEQIKFCKLHILSNRLLNPHWKAPIVLASKGSETVKGKRKRLPVCTIMFHCLVSQNRHLNLVEFICVIL